MYVPPHFAATDRRALVRLMRAHPFATLITLAPPARHPSIPAAPARHDPPGQPGPHAHEGPIGGPGPPSHSGAELAPFASHVPLLVDDGEPLTLIGHVARANPQAHDLESQRETLAIFHGPHAYVSPSWYTTAPATAQVPTWNYAAVHAYGTVRRLAEAELVTLLERLVDEFEAPRAARWTVDMATPERRALLRGIVGFAIAVTRLEGKFKLSQNRDAVDRDRVRAALAAGHHPDEHELAALMSDDDPGPISDTGR